jgi:ubiquinone/menaquinone biosynthesis C-methylase UbiE
MGVTGDQGDHRELVRREFTRQAAGFEAAGSLFRESSILEWISGHVTVPPGGRILDVAGGSGQVGRHLAGRGATAVIVDVTDATLAAGLQAALEEGQTDVVFVRGDATALPFPDDQFDVVVTRFALHHMEDPASAVAEMVRVCRPSGSVTVVDMVSGDARHDELERLRDPSHTRALTVEELEQLLTRRGRAPQRMSEREHTMKVEPWLDQARTPTGAREAIREVLLADADGGPASGLRASRTAGQLTVTQRWMLVGS